jgi:hypothetical protein
VAQGGGSFCELTRGADAAMPDAPPDVQADAQTRYVYLATVAECVDPKQPNPDKCRAIKGNDQLAVDFSDSVTTHPWDGFVRFDLDGAFAGGPVTNVTLQLTVTNASGAEGHTGVVWQVAPFTKPDLYTAEPAKIGANPLAGTQGTAALLAVVEWPLAASLALPSGSVYLGLTSSASDGVAYWNLEGANPPRLVIDVGR